MRIKTVLSVTHRGCGQSNIDRTATMTCRPQLIAVLLYLALGLSSSRDLGGYVAEEPVFLPPDANYRKLNIIVLRLYVYGEISASLISGGTKYDS